MLMRTHAAETVKDNLAELRRRAELESLRPFIIDSGCFIPSANPKTAPITMEELKKEVEALRLQTGTVTDSAAVALAAGALFALL